MLCSGSLLLLTLVGRFGQTGQNIRYHFALLNAARVTSWKVDETRESTSLISEAISGGPSGLEPLSDIMDPSCLQFGIISKHEYGDKQERPHLLTEYSPPRAPDNVLLKAWYRFLRGWSELCAGNTSLSRILLILLKFLRPASIWRHKGYTCRLVDSTLGFGRSTGSNAIHFSPLFLEFLNLFSYTETRYYFEK